MRKVISVFGLNLKHKIESLKHFSNILSKAKCNCLNWIEDCRTSQICPMRPSKAVLKPSGCHGIMSMYHSWFKIKIIFSLLQSFVHKKYWYFTINSLVRFAHSFVYWVKYQYFLFTYSFSRENIIFIFHQSWHIVTILFYVWKKMFLKKYDYKTMMYIGNRKLASCVCRGSEFYICM